MADKKIPFVGLHAHSVAGSAQAAILPSLHESESVRAPSAPRWISQWVLQWVPQWVP